MIVDKIRHRKKKILLFHLSGASLKKKTIKCQMTHLITIDEIHQMLSLLQTKCQAKYKLENNKEANTKLGINLHHQNAQINVVYFK